jgi:glycosyltransferase domain-containing protein
MNVFPLISIGIPTYNRPDSLRNLLNHVTKQTYSNLEIIVSDNCSTNAQVQQVLSEFAIKDARIKVFRQQTNIGLANNFQFVLEQSKGDFFMWMSDDDLPGLNYMEAMYSAIKDAPDYNLVMGRIALFTKAGEFVKYVEATRSIEISEPDKRVYAYFRNIEPGGYFYGLYRASVLKEIGYTNKMFGADILVSIYIIFSGKVKVIDSAGYRYFAGGSSGDHEQLARVVGLSQMHAVFFGFYETWVVAKSIMKKKLFKRISFFKRMIFCFKCSYLMLQYSHAFHSSYIVIKRKILRLVIGRQTLRPAKNPK